MSHESICSLEISNLELEEKNNLRTNRGCAVHYQQQHRAEPVNPQKHL